MYSIHFTENKKKISLRLHYNGVNSYLKLSPIFPLLLRQRNINTVWNSTTGGVINSDSYKNPARLKVLLSVLCVEAQLRIVNCQVQREL